jgi:hypothetical protein
LKKENNCQKSKGIKSKDLSFSQLASPTIKKQSTFKPNQRAAITYGDRSEPRGGTITPENSAAQQQSTVLTVWKPKVKRKIIYLTCFSLLHIASISITL